MSLFNELKRRNVFRVGFAYAVVAWLVMQFADVVLNNIVAPGWVFQAIMLLLAIGFPFVLIFSWAFEMTPEGLKKEKDVDRSQSVTPRTGRTLDRAIIVILLITLAYFAYDKFTVLKGSEPFSQDAAEQLSDMGSEKRALTPLSEGRSVERSQSDKSVAVLPFAFRSSNEEDQFFAEGMHDDLLTQLAKIGSLKVISRTSVLEYKDTIKKIPEIAAELGVSTIVEGGVQRSGSRIRFNAQLIDAKTDEHLWAETYNRELTAENLFDIQAEIARAIAQALQATLSPLEQANIDRVLTTNLEAWESYQRAVRMRQAQTNPGLAAGIVEINRTLSLDPDFAAAHSLKAIMLLLQYWLYDNDPALRDMAWESIQSGRAIDPELPELDIAEGFYYYWGFRDYEKALPLMQKASSALPNNSRVHMALAYVLRRMGHWDDTLAAFQRAYDLDPRNTLNLLDIGFTLSHIHRFEEAEGIYNKVQTDDPGNPQSFWQIGYFNLQAKGDKESFHHLNHLVSPINPESQFYTWRSSLYIRDFESAFKDADTWEEKYLDTKDYRVSREMLTGLTSHYAGDSEKARLLLTSSRMEFMNLLNEHEDSYAVLRSLCLIEGALGESESTAKTCKSALDVAPKDATLDGWFEFYAAKGLAMAGDVRAAVELLRTVLELDVGPVIYDVMYHPAFDGIRAEPAYKKLIEQFAPEKQQQ